MLVVYHVETIESRLVADYETSDARVFAFDAISELAFEHDDRIVRERTSDRAMIDLSSFTLLAFAAPSFSARQSLSGFFR